MAYPRADLVGLPVSLAEDERGAGGYGEESRSEHDGIYQAVDEAGSGQRGREKHKRGRSRTALGRHLSGQTLSEVVRAMRGRAGWRRVRRPVTLPRRRRICGGEGEGEGSGNEREDRQVGQAVLGERRTAAIHRNRLGEAGKHMP